MRGGLFLSSTGRIVTKKNWLSLEEQEHLLVQRGLHITSHAECAQALQTIGYYHLSGYARFFQVDPKNGDNNFRLGTRLSDILELVRRDALLRSLCIAHLARIELALRTGFAHRFGELVGPYAELLEPTNYSTTGSSRPLHELIKEGLDQSKQPFIVRHRKADGTYPTLPVWIAVEALAFGTLSRAIEHCANKEVVTGLADDLGLARSGFSSQVHSFVALRNACAHLSRLWNDVSKVPPAVPRNHLNRAKRNAGQFNPHSYYHVFVGLDVFSRTLGSPGLLDEIDSIFEGNQTYKDGLLRPRPYT